MSKLDQHRKSSVNRSVLSRLKKKLNSVIKRTKQKTKTKENIIDNNEIINQKNETFITPKDACLFAAQKRHDKFQNDIEKSGKRLKNLSYTSKANKRKILNN